MIGWMSVGLPHMHVIEWAAVVKVGSRSRGTKPVVNLVKVLLRVLNLVDLPGYIDDAHLTEDGDGVQGPSGPQCLAGRILGTWLPL